MKITLFAVVLSAIALTAAVALNPQPEPPGKNFILQDGKQAVITEKGELMLIMAKEKRSLAPAGHYVTRDGKSFTVGSKSLVAGYAVKPVKSSHSTH